VSLSSKDEAFASFVCDPFDRPEGRRISNDRIADGVIWACRTRRYAGALASTDHRV